jgi:hypothetical protein
MDMSDQLHAPVVLSPKERDPRYSLDRMLGGLKSRCENGGEEKTSAPPGIRIPVVHPLSSHYIIRKTHWFSPKFLIQLRQLIFNLLKYYGITTQDDLLKA